MTLESTNIYKIVETDSTQILRFAGANVPPPNLQPHDNAVINFECPKCHKQFEIQARLSKHVKSEAGKQPYPKNDIFTCNNCGTKSNLAPARLQIEAQTGKKIVV